MCNESGIVIALPFFPMLVGWLVEWREGAPYTKNQPLTVIIQVSLWQTPDASGLLVGKMELKRRHELVNRA